MGRAEDLDATAGAPLPALGALMRRFAVDWINRADAAVPLEIMAADYQVSIGGATISGRDAYLEATLGQLRRFPGLLITVHELVATADAVAMRFTEHGADARGRVAAWTGIGLFFVRDGVLARNVVEEDYLGRRRQLADGAPDPVEAPMAAPWAAGVGAPDPAAEQAVRSWLAGADPESWHGVRCDDGRAGRPSAALLRPAAGGPRIVELFSAGGRVAFHALQAGEYAGGLPGAEGAMGRRAELSMVGLVSVGADGIRGHVVRDRLGLARRLGT